MPGADAESILLVEDTASLATIYKAALTKAGWEVEHVDCVADARSVIARNSYSVILLDMMLPDGFGMEVLEEATAAGNPARFIVITSDGSINLAVEAMRAGAFDFLVKPFDDKRLLGAVSNAARARAMDDERRTAERGGTNGHTGAPAPAGIPGPDTDLPAAADEPAPGPMTADFEGFVGNSPVMRKIYATIRNVGRSTATVFINGESGTGKELAAHAIHNLSDRSAGPFVPINCGAIPADLLESEVFGHLRGSFTGAISDKKGAAAAADGGTLFLDEICEMHPALQTKLLRFLQTSTIQPVGATQVQRVDVRIVCATNRDPFAEVRAGRFREDLYYRLHVVPLRIPPLRERGDDVIEIAERLLLAYARQENRAFRALSPEVQEAFRRYPWPGNVREVQNVLRNAVVLGEGTVITAAMLPPWIRDYEGGMPLPTAVPAAAAPAVGPLPPEQGDAPPGEEADELAAALRSLVGTTLADLEEAFIAETVASCGGSIPKAARLLGVSPSTLYRKRDSEGEGRRVTKRPA